MIPCPARFPGLSFEQVAAELTREAVQRVNFYRKQIDRGRMTDGEARFELALVDAWQEDLARMQAAFEPVRWDRPASLPDPARHGLAWRARRDGLLRELALRQRVYPRMIAEGKADQPTADHRVRCLELLLSFYEDGLDWPTAPDQRAALYAEVTARQSGTIPQQELAFA